MRSGGNSNDWGRSLVQSPALCRSLVTLPSGKAGAADRGMNKNAYRGHRFQPTIIQLTVWMYARFTLSLREVAEDTSEARSAPAK